MLGGASFARETIGGLPVDTQYLEVRKILDGRIAENGSVIISTYNDSEKGLFISLRCGSNDLRFLEESGSHELTCNLSYSSSGQFSLNFSSDYSVSVEFSFPFVLNLSASPDIITTKITLPLKIDQIGDAYIVARAIVGQNDYLAVGIRLLVFRKSGISDVVFRVGVIILLIITTFFMGCEVDIGVIRSYLKRPTGPILGFLCQFIIMPATAIALSKLTPINAAFGFGLLISGCCPGGGASNVWTKLLGGDLNLSLTMTLFSSLAALGMLPLLLFAFARFFTAIDTAAVPYGPIVVNLLYLFIPVIAGLLVRRFHPAWADRFKRGVRPASCIFLVFVIGFGTFANFSIYRLMGRYPLLIVVGAALPIIGFLAGFLAALVCRRSWPVVVAISIETGVQNVGIAVLILIYAIPQPQGDLGAVMPVIIALTTPVCLLIWLIVKCLLAGHETAEKEVGANRSKSSDQEASRSMWIHEDTPEGPLDA
ncbi:hypothetical protein Aperf_G00000126435 [Anoplocephala perfoliata]